MTDFAAARQHMVDCQILPNKVVNRRVVDAFQSVPREDFTPKALRGVAYVDEDLEIAPGRYLLEPMVLARLIQEALITPEDTVLDVGCGTGYASALMARLCDVVVALEEDATLAEKAEQLLAAQGCDTVAVMTGPLAEGYPGQGPFDVILLEGAVEEVPPTLLDQLADGGRLLAVVGGGVLGKACLFTRRRGVIGTRELFDANVPNLPGFQKETGFVF